MSIPVQSRRSGIPLGPILLIALALGGVAALALHSGFMRKAHSEGVKRVDAGSTIRTKRGPTTRYASGTGSQRHLRGGTPRRTAASPSRLFPRAYMYPTAKAVR